ncbi:MAG: hypothetical protein NTY38_01920, partial [Acidobacteria bacterium]|nr:hypothetical protein [Acidobacteriota bacterium]
GLQNPLTFIRVVARNTGPDLRTSYFSAASRYSGPVSGFPVTGLDGISDYRFWGPVGPGETARPGVEFNPDWKYEFRDDAAFRSGKLLYTFSGSPKPFLWLTTTEVYTKPRAADTARIAELQAADFDASLGETSSWWEKELDRGIQIRLPEQKVVETFKASILYDMLARDHIGDDYIQTVNKFQYHAFFLRDGSYIVRAYDLAGYHDLARQCLEYFFRFQKADGNFVSQEGQFDGWGQALWAFGQHYKLTRDRAFAERAFPAVKKAVAWLTKARREDAFHLMPATNPGDAEFTTVRAHVTGHNFWSLIGLRNAIALAEAVGATQDVRDFQSEYDDYSRAFFRKLDEITAKTGGYIPPGVDVPGGQDWDNLLGSYPEQILPPFDHKVTATLEATRAKYAEGLMPYAGLLHRGI